MSKAKILGRLRGPIASAKENSRNGRIYTEAFWDKLLNSDLFKEGMENRVFLGELFHPDDTEEYSQIHCDDRSAVVLTDVKKTPDKEYIGTFDILPTKAGQCLRNLLDVGCVFGVSSRGLADYDTDTFTGEMADSYDLITWDVVAFPGIKSCRLHEIGAVAENLNKSYKVRVMERLKRMSDSDADYAKYINETLKKKEDFDDSLQVEDIMAKYNISDESDLYDYANIVTFDESGVPYYNHNGEKLRVYSPYNNGIQDQFNPGDVCLVDNIQIDEHGKCWATGDWLLLN